MLNKKTLKSLVFLLFFVFFSVSAPYQDAHAGDWWDATKDFLSEVWNGPPEEPMPVGPGGGDTYFANRMAADDHGKNPYTDTQYQNSWQQEQGANITAFVNGPGDWFGEPVARSTVFRVAQRRSDVAHTWARMMFYIGAGCGLCVLVVMAAVGKWQWSWFFMIVGGLFVIAGFQALINFLN
ncbi:MAG: hypothetical protein ACTSXQ_03880 [Alphaproteobacteria bacterium]